MDSGRGSRRIITLLPLKRSVRRDSRVFQRLSDVMWRTRGAFVEFRRLRNHCSIDSANLPLNLWSDRAHLRGRAGYEGEKQID